MSTDPFSQDRLNSIFKLSAKDPDKLISRESNTLEFKESFGWNSVPKYARTCSAFSNNKGGYIVFGIKNRPHLLKGLSGKALTRFRELDPAELTTFLNSYLSPELEWDIHEYELEGRHFGILYVYESTTKPILCTKNNSDDLKEGDIYYRYRGRSERIKFPELQAIFESRRAKEQKVWMRHLANIAKIGVRDAAVFDVHNGKVSGAGGSFYIDESLLSQLTFIKSGEFSEQAGRPTLRLIGSLESVSGSTAVIPSAKKIIRTRGIRTSDIILGMLDKKSIAEPNEYIKQICFESTAFLPVYYYLQKSGITNLKAVSMVEKVVARSAAKNKLIERLKNKKRQSVAIPDTTTPAALEKQKFAEKLRTKEVDDSISGKSLERCLQAIRGLTRNEIRARSKYLRDLLRTWFNRYYSAADGSLADNLRRAICWIDEALYSEAKKGE